MPDDAIGYSFDGIAWSSFNQPIRGARDGGSDGLKKLKVSSIDRAGNRSAPSDEFSFTLDTVAPAKLVPTLLKPVSGGSTTDGTVLIGAQEAGSVWEYSLDRGTTWQVGTGDRIKVKGRDESGTDGVKSVQLRQTDAAGNSSVSEVLEFNLLTKLDAPGLSVVTPVRILPDRTVLLDVGDSSVLPLGSKMVLEVSGRAGMTAIVTRDDGLEVGRLVLNAEGKGRLEVGRTLTLSGLKTVSGANTTANAVYELVQSGDTIFRLRNTSPAYFGAEFSENGVPLVDMSKPVYRTGPADSDWYVWSAQGGGYIISRRGDSGEWYREAPSSQPAQTPEAVKNWVAVNRSASLVAEEQLHNSGASSHQRTLEGVGVVNSNGWRETPWTYKAIQQSSPDNRSEPTEVKVRMFTTTPSALDLDAATSGVQGNLVLPATRSELLGGLSLFASPAAPAGNATRSIELVFNNKSPAGNQLISNNDLLVLDGTEVRMNAAHAKVGNTSIGSLKSYQMFDKLGTGTTSFSLLQQGSSLDTLGAWLRLGLKPAATAGLNNVALEMLGGFKRNGVDQYKLSPDLETGLSDVGLANIGLLYQLSVANTSSRPVIRVRFDSSNNVAGNVIELYEGGRLVGSKTLVASDLGGGPKEVDVAVFQSLSAGKHDLEVRYTDTGGNSVNSNLSVNVAAGGAPVTLSDLGVRGSKQSASEAQSLGQSGASYAVISDADTSFASGHGNQGPVFVGTVGGGSASDRYLVTIQMGGKVVAFEDVGAGSFAIGIPAGVLPPGYYQDLSISATVLTPGARLGQTTSMQGLKLGWYWAAQAGTSIVGGNGNDELVLGAAADPEIVGGIRVQTGAGDDRITVGSFGKTSGLKATVTDFTVGMDRVKVFGQIVNPDFVKNYVTASDLNGSTQLQIDLDGAGAGKLYYHLTLQGVQYNPSTIGSIFGV